MRCRMSRLMIYSTALQTTHTYSASEMRHDYLQCYIAVEYIISHQTIRLIQTTYTSTNYIYSYRLHIHTALQKCDTTICRATGWRRLIGSPKLQIVFHKRATKYGSLLQKMTCIQYIHVSSTSMYLLHPCIYYIHVSSTSMYLVHPCIWYIHVFSTSMYLVHPCIYYIHVSSTSMYLVHPCIQYIHVSGTSMYQKSPVLDTWSSKQMSVELQVGEDPQDALNCRSFSAKEPLIIGLFCCSIYQIR